jgi:hypothetical protein
MIPAVTMSIFVDGNVDRFLSDKLPCEERNHDGHRPNKRNILPRGSRMSEHDGETQSRDRQ